MDTLQALTENIVNHEKLIVEIEEMLQTISMTKINKDLAVWTAELLKKEKLELVAKANTLQSLRFYRELKEENDLPKR